MSSARDNTQFLNKVKSTLMILEGDTFVDEELQLHIESATELLISMGITESLANSNHPLVEGLIIIYVKTYFGFKADGSVRELPNSFYLLVRQLCLTLEGVDAS